MTVLHSEFARLLLPLLLSINPATGDNNAVIIWVVIGLLVVSAIVIIWMIVTSKKRGG